MKNPLLSRIVSTLLAIALSLSVVMAVFGITSSCLMNSEKFIGKTVAGYSDQTKSHIDERISLEIPDGKIPADAVAQAVDISVISYINGKITKSIILQSRVDVSTDSTLYNSILRGINTYAKENGIKLSKGEANKLASLAVDVISGYLSSAEFESGVMSLMHSKGYTVAAFLSIALIFASVILINVVNEGRHKMYSYIGTGMVSAGYIQIVVTVCALKAHVAYGVRYASLEPFDSVLADILKRSSEFQLYAGCFMLVAGLAMLVLNYRYFFKKNKRLSEQRELEYRMRNEYMMHYNSKNAPSTTVPGEREVMDIDF